MDQAQTIALYQPTLHAIALRMLRCKADAEDVVQETFIKWLNTEQEKIKNTKAYLITAVTNNCLNHLKALKRKKEEYLENFQWPEFVEKIRDTDFSAEFEVKLSSAVAILQEKLEPLERAVYLLKEVFDVDYKAIQEILDKKQDNCRQLLCRAKKKLNDEKESLNAFILPKKTALLEYFERACDDFSSSDLISYLRDEISGATPKTF